MYRQRSSYRTTDPQTYDEAYVAMEPFLSREDRASYISSLRDLSSHYDPVESVGVRLAPPPDELAAVAEEVEVENGGGDDDAVKLSKMLARRSGTAVRKITVLRVVTADPGEGMDHPRNDNTPP